MKMSYKFLSGIRVTYEYSLFRFDAELLLYKTGDFPRDNLIVFQAQVTYGLQGGNSARNCRLSTERQGAISRHNAHEFLAKK